MASLDISGATVLLVDDVDYNRGLIRQLLRSFGGPHVLEAAHGGIALDILSTSRAAVDFVISDFNMPVCHGLRFLKAVRMGDRSIRRDIPFAMLTAYSDVFLVETALALDVNAFLVKPVSKTMLEKRLRKMLADTARKPWIGARRVYEAVDVSSETIKAFQARRPPQPTLTAGPADAALRATIKESVSKLTAESGSAVAGRILGVLDDFVGRGVLTLEQVPQILNVIEAEGGARRHRPVDIALAPTEAPGPARDAAPAAPATRAKGGALAKVLAEIEDGAALTVDVRTREDKLVIEAGTPFTPRLFSVVLNLDDLGLIADAPGAGRAGVPAAPAARGGERQASIGDLKEGSVLARDLQTADGRVYIPKGQVLTGKYMSMLQVASELGHIGHSVWIKA